MVGAKAVHFDFLDCIYRRGKNGEFLYPRYIRPFQPSRGGPPRASCADDDRLVEAGRLCHRSIGSWRTCGSFIVRSAAELLHRSIAWIADIPYLLNDPDDLAPKTAGMKDSTQPVSEAGLKVWQDAIEIYASQLSTLFNSPDVMRQKISEHWAEQQGIRFWKPAQTS